MTTIRDLLTTLTTAAALGLCACSAGSASLMPTGDGFVAGGTGTSSSPPPGVPEHDASPPPAPPHPAPPDAGAPRADAGPAADASSPAPHDAGPVGVDAPAPPVGSGGTCATPACGTLGAKCGCQAIDSAGQTVLMGCQAGGQCVCLVNQQPVGNAFAENGACTSDQATTTRFLLSCPCQ